MKTPKLSLTQERIKPAFSPFGQADPAASASLQGSQYSETLHPLTTHAMNVPGLPILTFVTFLPVAGMIVLLALPGSRTKAIKIAANVLTGLEFRRRSSS